MLSILKIVGLVVLVLVLLVVIVGYFLLRKFEPDGHLIGGKLEGVPCHEDLRILSGEGMESTKGPFSRPRFIGIGIRCLD